MKNINIQLQSNNISSSIKKLGTAIAISLIFAISSPTNAQNHISNLEKEKIVRDSIKNEMILSLNSTIQYLEITTDTLLKRTLKEVEIDKNTIKRDFIPYLENIKNGLKELKEKIDVLDNNGLIYEEDLVKYREYAELLGEYSIKLDILNENFKIEPHIFKNH